MWIPAESRLGSGGRAGVGRLLVQCGHRRSVDISDLQAQARAHPRQSAILNDGVVTAAEYEEAVRTAVECIRARGWDAVPEFQDHTGMYQISIRPPDGAGPDAADVEVAYSRTVSPGALAPRRP